MKIIICTRDLTFGGAGVYIRGLLKEFDKNEKIEKILVIGPEKLEGLSPKIQFNPLRLKGKFFITKEPIFALRCKQKIEETLKKDRYDLIYACHPFLIFNRFKKPFIVRFFGLHKSFGETISSNWRIKSSKLFHFFYSYFDYKTIQAANKIIFDSKTTLIKAERYYPKYKDKFIHIPNFVDTTKFYPFEEPKKDKLRKKFGLEKNKKYLLFVGRLEPLKGIQLLIDAIKELRITIDIELLVAGKGILLKRVKSYSFVRYLGRISNEEINEVYNIADLFILPSFHEGCPITPMEAMASGCLVLASDVGDIKEIIGDDRLVFKIWDKEELKKKIFKFLNIDKEKRNKIKNALLKRVRNNYDINKVSKKMLDLCKNVKI